MSEFAPEDQQLLQQIGERLKEKNALIGQMEKMNRQLLDLNERTQRAESIKSEFLSLIKNEFNNPISSLLNLSRLLSEGRRPERIEEIGAMINMELLQLDFHMKNIFAAGEIEAGETANFYSTTSIPGLIDDVFEHMRYVVADKELEIQVDNQLDDERISTDAGKLSLVLLNLASNACEFARPRSRIQVRIGREIDDRIQIEFENQGDGIPAENRPRIFSPFTHFLVGSNRPNRGLGLGLSVAKGVVESLDGEIELTSGRTDTVFAIRFPAQPHQDDNQANEGGSEFFFEDGEDEFLEM